jgi:hypothetical protein
LYIGLGIRPQATVLRPVTAYRFDSFATSVNDESRHGPNSLTFGDVLIGIDIALEELGLLVFCYYRD